MGYDTNYEYIENQNVVHKREYFTGGISVRMHILTGFRRFEGG